MSEKDPIVKVGRRSFLKTGIIGSAGLVLGTQISCSDFSDTDKSNSIRFTPNAFLSINSNGDVVIIAHRSEMGTGIRTSLPAVIADELKADWSKVTIQQAIGDKETFGNQNTDASFSMRMFYMPMRRVGATARLMLERAAAQQWQVAPNECKATNHQVIHPPSGKKLEFGQLVETASNLAIPADDEIVLKDDSEFTLIGKEFPITDLIDIVQGKANFGLDTSLPDTRVAVIKRCPVAGGKIITFNAYKSLAINGVIKVFKIDSPGFPTGFDKPLGGIVVVADNTWAALKGREALEVEWDYGPNADYSSIEYIEGLEKSLENAKTVRRENGDVADGFKNAKSIVDSIYTLQHLSHAPMEPPCALAHAQGKKCELWLPTQNPQWVRRAVAKSLGLEEKGVIVNITLLGGGFGRKSKPDYGVEAAIISKEIGGPVKLMWTREDDIQHDFYHACSVQQIKVGLDDKRNVVAWNQKSMFPPIGGTSNAKNIQPGKNEMNKGLVDFPFDIKNIRIETGDAPAKTRVGWFRSVSNVQHAFAIGSVMDELAYARRMDPIQNALELLGPDRHIDGSLFGDNFKNYNTKIEDYPWDTSQFRNVIEEVAKKSNWGKSLPKGRAQGFCAHRCSLSYVACVIEVEVDESGNLLSIPELHYAVDCGMIVNPNSVTSQFEGGAVFALSLALKSAITFEEGKVQQSNFDNYRVASMKDTPRDIYVHLIDSTEKPTGIGEAPIPPVAPALANALYAATGVRHRKLPMFPKLT
ncbi:MAG: xanthine dehydrogenase family protein molybdopterin-binding subunit [Cyclobacteriaceae bacterium]